MRFNWKAVKCVVAAALTLALGAGVAAAANKFNKPKSVLHVVTLYYKDGTTDEQKKSVQEAIEKMASEVPGIKNVWMKTLKVQGAYMEKITDKEKGGEVSYKAHPFTDVIVIEFEDQAAFDKYTDHPAHKAFEKIYLPLRGRSSTNDISN